MTPDETDLIDALYEHNLRSGKRPSVVEAGMKYLPDWDDGRLLAAAQGLSSRGHILNVVGPMWNVDLSSEARKGAAARAQGPSHQTINIGTNTQSPIQQVAPGGVGIQSVAYTPDRDDLSKIVKLFREFGHELNLEGDAAQAVEANVATIEAQLQAPEPHPVIVREAGKSLRTIAEGAIGSIAATALTNPTAWAWLLGLAFT